MRQMKKIITAFEQTTLRFVSPGGSLPHLHSTNRLLCQVVRPGYLWIREKCGVSTPFLTKSDQQVTQFIHCGPVLYVFTVPRLLFVQMDTLFIRFVNLS